MAIFKDMKTGLKLWTVNLLGNLVLLVIFGLFSLVSVLSEQMWLMVVLLLVAIPFSLYMNGLLARNLWKWK